MSKKQEGEAYKTFLSVDDESSAKKWGFMENKFTVDFGLDTSKFSNLEKDGTNAKKKYTYS